MIVRGPEFRWVLLLVAACGLCADVGAVESPAGTVEPFFRQHCFACHGPDKQKGDLRLDTLAVPSKDNDTSEIWDKVLKAISTGEMPPEKRPRPDQASIDGVVGAVTALLADVPQSRPPALRRLNRHEYENTLHDLLGTDTPLADLLPEDGSVQGFDNVAQGLSISSVLMERYLEAADTAFEGVIRRIKPSPPATRRAVLMEEKENIASVREKKGGVIEESGAFVDFTPDWPPARVDACHPIEEGMYRCRVAVWPHEPGARTLAVDIYVGPLFGPGKRELVGEFDVTGTPEDPRIIEFTTHMEEGDALHILARVHPEHVTWRDKHEERPGVAIQWAETYGPLDQDWPSLAQQRLFGTPESIHMADGESIWMRYRKGVKRQLVESDHPREDAERIIRELLPRAFRRPVDKALADQFVGLTLARLDEGRTFEQAVRAGVTAVLCSPHFLLLNSQPKVDDYAVASRLSYFLWSSQPDDALMALASAGRLSDPVVRHAEVERLLKDPKAERFVESFTGQWLDLREIEFTTPDAKLYPEYDELLLHAMLAETRGFFRHVLQQNLDIRNFIDSDFTVLNQRLAEHYGIPGVRGHEHFQVVHLPEDSIRGGLLTQASILKVTANGTTTSPVLRGAWVLDRILGQPAPPPPPGVPAVEPDIRGATTIREQLEKHRGIESCARCHNRIDPPGFALECFDPVGGFRDTYRAIGGKGKRVAGQNYQEGLPVQTDGVTQDGRAFAGFQDFRQMLLDDSDTFAHALAGKLLVYATGRQLVAADRKQVDQIVAETRRRGGGLRDMIHAVIDSELFVEP